MPVKCVTGFVAKDKTSLFCSARDCPFQEKRVKPSISNSNKDPENSCSAAHLAALANPLIPPGGKEISMYRGVGARNEEILK